MHSRLWCKTTATFEYVAILRSLPPIIKHIITALWLLLFAHMGAYADSSIAHPKENSGESSFNINIKLPLHTDLPIKEEVTAVTTSIYEILTENIGYSYNKKISVNLHIFANRELYEFFQEQFSLDIPPFSSGFYILDNNIAASLHHGSIKNTVITSAHEITHVILENLFGDMPDWFNEGMAEYFENLKNIGTIKVIKPARNWDKMVLGSYDSFDLMEFINTKNNKWDSSNRTIKYAYAWSLIYFLMEPDNKAFMRLLMLEMAKTKDKVFNVFNYINENYSGGYGHFESNWRDFVLTKKTVHYSINLSKDNKGRGHR